MADARADPGSDDRPEDLLDPISGEGSSEPFDGAQDRPGPTQDRPSPTVERARRAATVPPPLPGQKSSPQVPSNLKRQSRPTTPPAPPPGKPPSPGLDDVDVDIDVMADDPPAPAAPSPAAAAPALSPIEVQIATPSVLDDELSRAAADSAEARAEKLAADLAAAEASAKGSARAKTTVAQLAYELGELYETRLGDPGRAVKAYGKALAADPTHRANLWAIRRVFYRRGLWPNLVKLTQAEAKLAKDPAARADLLLEKGFIQEVHQKDTAAAKEAFDAAASADPESLTALLRRERVALAEGKREVLAEVWRELADRSEIPERKLCYLLDLARLASGDGDAGLDRASDLLAEAAALGVLSERVARERERLGERRGDEAEILAALETRIACLKARLSQLGAEPAEQNGHARSGQLEVIALRRRQARVARGAGDAESAWEYLRDAAALSPEEPLVLADLADLAEKLGKFEELAELCEGLGSAEDDPAQALSLSLRRADALFKGGRHGEAAALLAHVEEMAPGYLPAVAVAERDALMRGDLGSLAAAYARGAEAARQGTWRAPASQSQKAGPDDEGQETGHDADRAGAAAEFLAASDIYALYLGDTERARHLGEAALEASPTLSPALWAMVELCEMTGNAEDAAAILERAVSDEHADRSYMLERLAQIYETLARADDLARVLDTLVRAHENRTDLRWRLADALAAANRPDDRIAALTDIAGVSEDPGERAAALALAAEIADRELSEPARALPLCQEARTIAPGDAYLDAYVTDLCRRTGAWEELAVALRESAGQASGSDAAIAALREAAEVIWKRQGRPQEAAAIFAEILEQRPEDERALWGAAEALGQAGDVTGAAEFLERLAGSAQDPAACARALAALGDLAAQSDDRRDLAIDAYRRAAEADSGALYAPVALAALAGEAADPALHATALCAIADGVSDSAARADMLERAGWLALAGGDGERASEAFAAAAVDDPERAGPALGRALAAASARDSSALAAALGDLAARTIGAQMASAAALRAASLADADGDLELAAKRAWQRDAPDDAQPGGEPAPDRDASAATSHPAALCATLEYPPPPAKGDAEAVRAQHLELAALYARRAELCGSPALATSFALDRVESLEAAGRLAEAGRVALEVIDKAPDSLRALCALRRIARRGNDRNTAATAALALARVVRSSAAKLELYREAAAIYDDELGNTDAAVSVYRRILVEDPGAAEYERLHDIYTGHGDAHGLFELLSHRLADLDRVAPHARSRAPLLYERAVLRDDAGDLEGAAADLAAVVAADGDHTAGLGRLADVLARMGDSERAAAAWRRYLSCETDPAKIAEGQAALAELLAGPLGDPAAGAELLGEVLAARPTDVKLHERRVALLAEAGWWEELAVAYDELSRLRPDAGDAAADQVARARVLADKLGQTRESRAALERARALEPTSIDVVFGLADLAAAEGSGSDAVLSSSAEDLRRAIAGTPGDAALYEGLARVAERLGEGGAAALARAAHAALTGQPPPVGAPSGLPTAMLPDFYAAVMHPGARDAALWRAIAEAVAKIIAADPGGMGLSRGDRQGKNLARRFPAVAAWAEAFGMPDIEVYVSDTRSDLARAVAGERPTLALGAKVAAATTAPAAFQLGRALGEARADLAGISALAEAGDLAVWMAAACRVAEIEPPARSFAAISDRAGEVEARTRELSRALSRAGKKALLRAAAEGAPHPATFWHGAHATLARAGLLVAGDLGAALAGTQEQRAISELCAWAVSDAYADARDALACRPAGAS